MEKEVKKRTTGEMEERKGESSEEWNGRKKEK